MNVLVSFEGRSIDSEGRRKRRSIGRVPSFECCRSQISKPTFAFDGDTKIFRWRNQNFGSSSKQKLREIKKFINIDNKTVFRRRKKLLRTSFLHILRVTDLKKTIPTNFTKSWRWKIFHSKITEFATTSKITENNSISSKFRRQMPKIVRFWEISLAF